ncbi:MAG TPA: UrcA family protein [Phenylobacterium sp.]|jgi:UrcA family protein|nr:UrcA family protein [Phenylobacterium sp.]
MRLSALATLTAAAALVCAAPAFAQTVDELTVTGHLNTSRLQSLTERVSFADLDLTRHADREALRLRVNDAARRVCTQLNQDSPNPANMGRSCQEVAVRGALDQVRYAFADARDQAYADTYGAPASATAPDRDPEPDPR